jgi:hypothetical protein
MDLKLGANSILEVHLMIGPKFSLTCPLKAHHCLLHDVPVKGYAKVSLTDHGMSEQVRWATATGISDDRWSVGACMRFPALPLRGMPISLILDPTDSPPLAQLSGQSASVMDGEYP